MRKIWQIDFVIIDLLFLKLCNFRLIITYFLRLRRICEAKAKYFHGAKEFLFRDLGRSMHNFSEPGRTDRLGASLLY